MGRVGTTPALSRKPWNDEAANLKPGTPRSRPTKGSQNGLFTRNRMPTSALTQKSSARSLPSSKGRR